jgi:metallo-beta-lactamase family protein
VGTLGRHIVDGEKNVSVYGEEITVGAHIWTTNGFSSHADQPILLDWIRQVAPKHLVLVHGEDEILDVFVDRIREELSIESHVATLHESMEI